MNNNTNNKLHAFCLPFPAQSHVKAMLKLSKLLHNKGFHITFVNTESIQNRFLKSNDSIIDTESLRSKGFRFETIPDNSDSTDLSAQIYAIMNEFSGPVLELVERLNDRENSVASHPVSCFVVDGFMSFAMDSAVKVFDEIPLVKFFPISAVGLMGCQQIRPLMDRGIVPLKDNDDQLKLDLENKIVDWIPGIKGLRFRDLPPFWQTTDTTNFRFKFILETTETTHKASALVIQSFDALEQHILETLKLKNPNLYTIGPLQLLLNRLPEYNNDVPLKSVTYNLWKEETECLKWLDFHKRNSVLYVNFGSLVTLTPQQVVEFAWGLANSNHPFLWIMRPDLVIGESSCLPQEFYDKIKERSLILKWCPQEDVLNHPSVGGFLTHCGWNSMLESVSSGVPLLCYPRLADQQSNSWLACSELGFGLEIDKDVKRFQVEEVVRELMEREKGKIMKSKAMELKKFALEATSSNGSSSRNLDDLISQVLMQK